MLGKSIAAAMMFVPLVAHADPATTAACMTATSPAFEIRNGVIYDPDRQPFLARGVGVIHGDNGYGDPSASKIHAAFPGTNFVRLAIYKYDRPEALARYIKDLTSHGIVVELENHDNGAGSAGGGQGVIFTDAALVKESTWYASVAKAFKDNPYVWFGTSNEPSSSHVPNGSADPAALSRWQGQTYKAIRDTGSNAPILIEVNGGNKTASFAQGYDPSVYKTMTNIILDIHFYGWLVNYSTDQAVVNNFLAAAIATAQKNIVGSAPALPVIIGEFGNSTTGTAIDRNGKQVVQAVGNSGVGYAAWAWGNTRGDGLLNGDGYGAQVAQMIKAGAKAAASTAPSATSGCPVPRPG